MTRMTKADCERLVERLTKLTGFQFSLDSAFNKRRLVRKINSGGGERTISPLLTPGPLYEWIHAFIAGIEVGQEMTKNTEENAV